jgi:hypothetical protein
MARSTTDARAYGVPENPAPHFRSKGCPQSPQKESCGSTGFTCPRVQSLPSSPTLQWRQREGQPVLTLPQFLHHLIEPYASTRLMAVL